jgi:hypothetical protein
MKTYDLIIGDNSTEIAVYAALMFEKTLLVTKDMYDQIDTFSFDCLYTSLADIDADQLLRLSQQANAIHYWPPLQWESKELLEYTVQVLTKIVSHYKIPIRNFTVEMDPTNSLTLMDYRKSSSPQIWVTGCSYAYGFGLIDSKQRYIEIVAEELRKPFSDLSSPGTSIGWAADQLLRSDIQQDDIVIWGITGINRVDYYIDNQQIIVPGITNYPSAGLNKFFNKMITDDNRVNQSIKSIYQVKNFVEKSGAKLVLIFHKKLNLYEYVKVFEPYLWALPCYALISDQQDSTVDGHPGPITNKIWAAEILQFLNSIK